VHSPPARKSSARARARRAEGARGGAGAGDFKLAAERFSEAMRLAPSNFIYPTNRSAALLKLDKLEGALEDATLAANMNPQYAKAHWRKGQALCALGRLDLAVEALEEALRLDEGHEGARTALENAKVRRRTLQQLQHLEDRYPPVESRLS
jgi:tetratricopeptide (TPR) repeat protein